MTVIGCTFWWTVSFLFVGDMDSESCALVNKTEDPSRESCEHRDEIGGIEEDKKKVEPPVEPTTPYSKKEDRDVQLELNSPLTVAEKIPKVLVFNSKASGNKDSKTSVDGSGSPQTPNDGVFDPFAPGSEDKVLAPDQCKKYFDEARASVARRLDFSSSVKTLIEISSENDAESISDEEILQAIYDDLMQVIVAHQTEDALAGLSKFELDSSDCRTPDSTSLLSEVSDTCPGAPVKKGRSRIADLRLCRRLEF